MIHLDLEADAKKTLRELRRNRSQGPRLKKVEKALKFLSVNPSHPGLHTHGMKGAGQGNNPWPKGTMISYVENRTPSAWRIYWKYGDNNEIQIISILRIGPHE